MAELTSEEVVQILKTDAGLRGVDLSGLDLPKLFVPSNAKLNKANFSHCNLANSRFVYQFKSNYSSRRRGNWFEVMTKSYRKVDFRYANLTQADLSSCIFHSCDFRGTDLSNADLRYVTFKSCKFQGVNLTGARLEGIQGISVIKLIRQSKQAPPGRKRKRG